MAVSHCDNSATATALIPVEDRSPLLFSTSSRQLNRCLCLFFLKCIVLKKKGFTSRRVKPLLDDYYSYNSVVRRFHGVADGLLVYNYLSCKRICHSPRWTVYSCIDFPYNGLLTLHANAEVRYVCNSIVLAGQHNAVPLHRFHSLKCHR